MTRFPMTYMMVAVLAHVVQVLGLVSTCSCSLSGGLLTLCLPPALIHY